MIVTPRSNSVALRTLWTGLAFLWAGPVLAQPGQADRLREAGYAAQQVGDVAAAVQAFESVVELDPTARANADLGYALLAAERAADAVVYLERAAALDPDLVPDEDLGFLYTRLGRTAEAADRFEGALDDDPTDAVVALQLAYAYAQLDRRRSARRQFRAVVGMGDEAPAAQAQVELDALEGRFPVGAVVAELYLAPLYQERFDLGTVPLVARLAVTAHQGLGAQLYGSIRGTRDTRTVGGARPVIFSDNVAIPAVGVRVRPSISGPTAYAEVGRAIGLVDGVDVEDPLDVRAGVFQALRQDEGDAGALVWSAYADASYYSRFEDVIVYAQGRPGVRLAASGWGGLDAYVVLAAVADTRGLYYNNVLEAGPGLRWAFPGTTDVMLRAEYARGLYTATDGAPTSTYGEARVTLIISRALRLR